MIDEIKLANFAQRTGAYFIDMLLVTIVSMIIIYNSAAFEHLKNLLINYDNLIEISSNAELSAKMSSQMSMVLYRFFASYVILYFVYIFLFLSTSGQTIGCLLCSCRHVNLIDYGPANYKQAFVKSLVFVFMSIFFNGILFVLALLDKQKQTLADKSINQVVICV